MAGALTAVLMLALASWTAPARAAGDFSHDETTSNADYITFPVTTDHRLTADSQQLMTCVWLEAADSASTVVVVSQGTQHANYGSVLYLVANNDASFPGHLQFRGYGTPPAYHWYRNSDVDVRDGGWHFACLRRDAFEGGSGGIQPDLYLDGAYVGTSYHSGWTNTPQFVSVGFAIGGWNNTANTEDDIGKVGAVGISKRLWSSAELHDLYGRESCFMPTETLGGHYTIMEGPPGASMSGAGSIIDLSSSGHDGTPVGTTAPKFAETPLRGCK